MAQLPPPPEEILGDNNNIPSPESILGGDVKKKVGTEKSTKSAITYGQNAVDGLKKEWGSKSLSQLESAESKTPDFLKSQKYESPFMKGLREEYLSYQKEQKVKEKARSIPNKATKSESLYGVQYAISVPEKKVSALGWEAAEQPYLYEASPNERNVWFKQGDNDIQVTGIDYWNEIPNEKKYIGAFGDKTLQSNFYTNEGVSKISADFLKHLSQTDKDKFEKYENLINLSGKKLNYNDVYSYNSERNMYELNPEFKDYEHLLQKTNDGNYIFKKPSKEIELQFLSDALEHQMNIITYDYLSRTDGGKNNIDENYPKYKAAYTKLMDIKNDIVSDKEFSEVIEKSEYTKKKQEEDQKMADAMYEKYYKDDPVMASIYYNVGRPIKQSVQSTVTGFFSLPQMMGIDIPEFKAKAKEGANLLNKDIDPTELQGGLFSGNYKVIIPTLTRMAADMYTMAVGGRVVGGGKLASIGAGMVNQYSGYFETAKQEALNKGYTEKEAEDIANVNGVVGSLLTSVVESFNLNLEKAISGEALKKEITNNTVKVLAKGGTYKDVLRESWDFVKREIPKENLEEFANLVTDKMTNAMTNESYGLELDASFNAEEIGETMFYTTLLGGLGAIRNGKTPNKLEKAYLFDALSDPESFSSKMNSMIEKNQITEDEAKSVNEYLTDVNNIVKGLPNMKISKDGFIKLIGLLEKKKQLKERKKGAYIDDVFKEKTEKKEMAESEKIDEEIKAVLKDKEGETIQIKDGQIIEKYDSENKTGVSGEVREGQELEQKEPKQEGGVQEVSPSGVVQEEQVDYDITDGHHRYIAYTESGVKEIPAVNEKGEQVNIPIEKLRPTQKLSEKDRATIESLKESIAKGEKIEPIKVEEAEEEIAEQKPLEEESAKRWDKRVIDQLDNWDKNLSEFSKGTLGINIPVVVAKGAVKAMKGVVKTAASIQDIIQAGLDYVKTTDWYLASSENDRRNIEREFEKRYYENVGKTKEYKQKEKKTKDTAKNKNKAIRKRARSKDKNIPASDKAILKDFTQVDIKQVEDLDEYTEIADQLLSGVKGDRTLSNEQVREYIDKQVEKQTEKERQDLLKEYAPLVEAGFIKPDATIEEIYNIVTEPSDKTEKKEKLKEAKEKKLNDIRNKTLMEIDVINEMDANGEFEDLNEYERKILDDIKKLDISKLKFDDIVKIQRVVSNIISNQNFSNAKVIDNAVFVSEGNTMVKESLEDIGYDKVDTYLNENTNKWSALAKNIKLKLTSLPNLVKAISVFRDLTTKIRVASGVQELMAGHAKVVNAMEKFNEEYNKVIDKENSTPESQTKQAYYSLLSMAEDQDDFNRIKDLIRQTGIKSAIDEINAAIDKKKIDKAKGKELIDLLKQSLTDPNIVITASELKSNLPKGDFTDLEVYDNSIKKANSIEDISLTESERKKIDFFREQFADIKDAFFATSEIYANIIPEEVANYLPTIYGKSKYDSKGDTEASLEADIDKSLFMKDMVNTRESGSTQKKKKNVLLPEGKKLSTNFDYDMMRQYRDHQYHINTLKSRSNIVAILDNPKFRELFGSDNADLLKKQIVKTIQAQQNKMVSDPLVASIYGATNRLTRFGTSMVLGSLTTGRIKQYLPGFIGAKVKLGKNAGLLEIVPSRSFKKGEKDNLFKYSNLPERINTKAGFKTESYVDEKEIQRAKKVVRGFMKAQGFVGESLDKITDVMMSEISAGDVALARRVWMAYYADYKLRNGEEVDWDKEAENPDKMASAHADQLIEETMSTNSFSNLPDWLRRNRDMGDLMKNIIFPFSTFVINQRVRLSNSVKQLRVGNKKEKEEAAKDIAAVMGESIAFTNINLGLLALRGLGAYYILLAAGYDDEEAERLSGEIDMEKIIKANAGNLSRDLFVSGVGAPVETLGSNALNKLYKYVSGEDQDLIYTRDDREFSVMDYIGTTGIAIDKMIQAWEDVDVRGGTMGTKGGFGNKAEYFEVDLDEKEKNIYNLLIANDILSIFGINDQMLNGTLNKVRNSIKNDMLQKYGGREIPFISGGKEFKKQSGGRVKSRGEQIERVKRERKSRR